MSRQETRVERERAATVEADRIVSDAIARARERASIPAWPASDPPPPRDRH